MCEAQFTTKEKGKIIKKVSIKLRKSYAIREKGIKMARALQANLKNQDYAHITDKKQFANKVSKDLHAMVNDPHLALVYKPEAYFKRDSLKKINQLAGNINARILQDEIGYLDINNFTFSKNNLDIEINKLGNCKAIVIDLRDCLLYTSPSPRDA